MSKAASPQSTATAPKSGATETATVVASTGEKVPDPSRKPPYTHTRASGYWAAVVVGLLVLLVLIIFILENGQRANVSFLGLHTHLPQGAALLLAAIIGGLFVMLAGTARILQLRSRAHGQVKKKPRDASRRRRTKS